MISNALSHEWNCSNDKEMIIATLSGHTNRQSEVVFLVCSQWCWVVTSQTSQDDLIIMNCEWALLSVPPPPCVATSVHTHPSQVGIAHTIAFSLLALQYWITLVFSLASFQGAQCPLQPSSALWHPLASLHVLLRILRISLLSSHGVTSVCNACTLS